MKDKTLKYSVLKTKASDELDAEVQEELKIPDSTKSISSLLEEANEILDSAKNTSSEVDIGLDLLVNPEKKKAVKLSANEIKCIPKQWKCMK